MPAILLALVLVTGSPWIWPLDQGTVIRGFDPPQTPWGVGHRGIDIEGSAGQQVRSIGDGTIAFRGQVGGKQVIVVSHGAVRSTYEPVSSSLSVGTAVRAGDVVGVLLVGHCRAPQACLHLGLRRGDAYLNPLPLFQRVVLKSPARG